MDTAPLPAPEMVRESRYWRTKLAVTAISALISRAQAPEPPQPSDQPANREPASGWAASETRVPAEKLAAHADPQSRPAGLDRTVPEPFFFTVSTTAFGGGGGFDSKVADTARSRS